MMESRERAIFSGPTSMCARAGARSLLPPCAPPLRVRPGNDGTCAMATLTTDPNIARPDDFYEELIDLHRDLTEAQSALVNAKLILLLANHIGDPDVLRPAMAAARADIPGTASGR